VEIEKFSEDKLAQVAWLGHSSTFDDTLHVTNIEAIPSFSRVAILRWLIDSEPDVHFRLRPFFTRLSPCRCGCGVPSSLYPDGFVAGSVAAPHLYSVNPWALHCRTFPSSSFHRFIDASPHVHPPPLAP